MKVDRLLNLKLSSKEKVTVPSGELWKFQNYGEELKVNGIRDGSKNKTVTNGDVISSDITGTGTEGTTHISGLVFIL